MEEDRGDFAGTMADEGVDDGEAAKDMHPADSELRGAAVSRRLKGAAARNALEK